MDEFDVVVLGSGAAGLTAAVTAALKGSTSVAVFEKSHELGGTSTWSGGHVWIPNNPHQAEIGVSDSKEEAQVYLRSLSRGLMDEKLVDAYLDAGPEMVSFLDAKAGTEFYAVPDFPDYHPEHPGGKPGGGRTLECPLFAFEQLGEWAAMFTHTPYYADEHLTMSETSLGAVLPKPITPEEHAHRVEHDERGRGPALTGRLFRGCLQAGVRFFLSHRGVELLRTDGGRVTGVRFETPEGDKTVTARRGVVLATGGFEWNEQLVKTFIRGPLTHPVSPRTNTGDGLLMSMRAGAMLGNMGEAWWIPCADLPEGINDMNRAMINADRTRPRSIMVNREGRRFTNEAANYNAFGGAFRQEDVARFEYANLPCWLIFDQEYLRRYGTIGPWPAGDEAPPWLPGFESLEALAEHLGIPAANLVETVQRFNANAADGVDPDFHRGESAHDRWWGDPAYKGDPRGTLGPLDTPPYYAISIKSGALGTKGGPQIDVHGQVVDLDGRPIPGLYAAGNVMASPFASTYGGAGGTLGPAMVFGYLAATHIVAG
jgi:succinate dehydrogenase/fumarate reductase flavoprotein subunit